MTKTIIWDFDDVLFDTLGHWVRWYGDKTGKSLRFSDLQDNPPLNSAGISFDKYRALMDEFRSSEFALDAAPDSFLSDWFEKYGPRFIHIVLTARPLVNMGSAAQWTFTHFGKWIHTISYINSPRPDDKVYRPFKSKGEWITYFQPTGYYIDDSPFHIDSVVSNSITPFLLSKPWNSGNSTLPEILTKITTENGF
ncbi:MAG: hypothetical protein ACE5D7_08115 [Fidelibacterota bacterium]